MYFFLLVQELTNNIANMKTDIFVKLLIMVIIGFCLLIWHLSNNAFFSMRRCGKAGGKRILFDVK